MPITKSAIKKERVDKRRTAHNLIAKGHLKSTVKEARENQSAASLKAMYSAMDRAVKLNLIARGHASRLKSRISKLTKKK
ncbi:MAG: 30S ribosomal protein S20 [bacterium]